MSRPGFSKFQKSMCKFVPDFIRRCVRDDPYLCWQKLMQENIAPVDGDVHLVHIFKRRLTWHGTSRNHYVKIEEYARNEVRLTYLKFNYFVLPASVGASYVATQFHASNSDGRMSKGVKTSQRCE